MQILQKPSRYQAYTISYRSIENPSENHKKPFLGTCTQVTNYSMVSTLASTSYNKRNEINMNACAMTL